MPKGQQILASFPAPLTHLLVIQSSPPPEQPKYIIWLWSLINSFCGISIIQAVYSNTQYFSFIQHDMPTITANYMRNPLVSSFFLLSELVQGASAVLIYGAIDSPLAQPRALFGGHFIGALLGVCITKLFRLLPTEERFLELQWLAASLSCAVSIVAMQITSTTHPPAGEYKLEFFFYIAGS